MLSHPTIIFISLLTANSSAMAGKDTRFQLNLGSSINTFDSDLRTDSKIEGFNKSIPIDMEKDLNFDEDVKINWLSGYWRFASRHRIRFEYLPISRSSSGNITQDIDFNGSTIKAGAQVSTDFDTYIYDVNYIYSVYQGDKLEVGLTAGLYWMDVDIDIKAQGNVDIADEAQSQVIEFYEEYSDSVSVDAPVPLFGIGLSYAITPRWGVNAGARYLDVDIGDYEGRVVSLLASTDYFFTKHFGTGLSVGTFDMQIEGEGRDLKGTIDWAYDGAQAYLSIAY